MSITPAQRDILERAGRTFVQFFLVTWLAANFSIEKSVLLSALGAGVSAAMTILFPPESSK